MRVFVSWSGDDSKGVAEVLRKYLPMLIQGTEVFMSEHDIASGARWRSEVAKELSQCNFGICCLTPSNLTASWLLFEAGALTKLDGGRVCCLLLRGLTPASVTGPLLEFQNRVFTKAEFRQLLADVNAATEKPIPDKTLELLFAKFWPDISDDVNNELAKSEPSVAPPRRSTQDLLEEVLSRVRNLEADTAKRSQMAAVRRWLHTGVGGGKSNAATLLGPTWDEQAFEDASANATAKSVLFNPESSAVPHETKQSENSLPPEKNSR